MTTVIVKVGVQISTDVPIVGSDGDTDIAELAL